MINSNHLTKLGVPAAIAEEWVDPLVSTMAVNKIDTPQRQAAFLAQVIHESNGLRSLVENMNYTPTALMATFNNSKVTRFTKILAEQFGRTTEHPANQPMIGMIAYANRMGNGSVDSGEGWKYRGRGPFQLTGKNNYTACGAAIGVDLVHNPDALLDPVVGARSAGWFWSQAGNLNALADKGQIDAISRAINGGDNGLAARRSLYEQALKVLA